MKKQTILPFLLAACILMSSCKNSSPETKWEKIELGSMGLSVEVPFTFKEKNIESQLTPAVKKLIKKMETFVNDEKGSYYAINMAEYGDEVEFTMDRAVDGALNEMRQKAGGKISNRKDEMKKINGNEASLTSATITDRNDSKMEFQMAIINKGQKMYQLMGLYKQGSDEARKNTAKMLESIRINQDDL
jgi:hypothetical protein